MTRMMAQSPAVLEGYLSFAGALAGGALAAALREQIALTTAEANGCEYCLSAHSLMGKGAGLDPAEIDAARGADSTDPRAKEALRFAHAVLTGHGHVSDSDIARARAAGFADGEIGEIIASVALNVFTNYFNSVTKPQVDFPVVKPRALAKAA
jgi:AhpD family alkylhydroperoxidase